jgi:succinate dehydrogenase/fumarate reductase flavoprotein subunit
MRSVIEAVPIETDVLIVGGGLAGCMAAIKAAESGVKVTIAEKADTLSSGCGGTGIDHTWAYIPEIHGKIGWTIDDLIEDHSQVIAGNLINRELLYLVASEAYDRMLDLEKFGINIRFPDSRWPGNFRIVSQFHSIPSTINYDGYDLKIKLTREARRRGVNIINRLMITDLLTHQGQIAGAVGVSVQGGKYYFFKAKSVVVSTGRINRLSRAVTGVWGNTRIPVNETGDGRAMALNAGASIINMEFYSNATYSIGNFELSLGSPRNTVQPAGSVVGPDSKPVIPRTYFSEWDVLKSEKIDSAKSRKQFAESRKQQQAPYAQMHRQGQGPFYLDLTNGTEDEIKYIEWSIGNEGKGRFFLNYLKAQEGFDFRRDRLEFLPTTREIAGTAASGLLINIKMETEIPGLFGAGDDVGGVPWMCSPGAFTMGWRAGESAAKRAKAQQTFLPVNDPRLKSNKELFSQILNSKNGQNWLEVEYTLQNIMDYYAGEARSEPMLRRGLERMQALQKEVSFKAESPHELGRCMEVKSIMENAEMILRASLERKETRRAPYGFFRADFPEQNDNEYLGFIAMKKEGEDYRFQKIPVKH